MQIQLGTELFIFDNQEAGCGAYHTIFFRLPIKTVLTQKPIDQRPLLPAGKSEATTLVRTAEIHLDSLQVVPDLFFSEY